MIVSIEHRFYLLLCEALLLYPDNFCVGVHCAGGEHSSTHSKYKYNKYTSNTILQFSNICCKQINSIHLHTCTSSYDDKPSRISHNSIAHHHEAGMSCRLCLVGFLVLTLPSRWLVSNNSFLQEKC